MSEELKPCPFCGNTNVFLEFKEDALVWVIICARCLLTIPWVSREYLIEKWNLRPLEDTLRNQLAIAKEALFFYATHLIEGGKVASEALAEIEKLKS